MKDKYIKTFGNQYSINSPNNSNLMKIFHEVCAENGILHSNQKIFQYLNAFENKNEVTQLSLFD